MNNNFYYLFNQKHIFFNLNNYFLKNKIKNILLIIWILQ